MAEKFKFPNAGIHIVSAKIGEADYFLKELKSTNSSEDKFNYIFSAFVSALRSITFSLQYVMSKYPGFDIWYTTQQEKLRKSSLAKAFVEFRNQAQKTGIIPILPARSLFEGILYETAQFYVPSNSDLKEVPKGEVVILSEQCLKEVLVVIADCYKEFDSYIDPRMLCTKKTLSKFNWSIDDLEEFLGFPRGYTDINFESVELNNDEIRLTMLSSYCGDETLQEYLDKYLDVE